MVKVICLENWKERRNDKRVELYWKSQDCPEGSWKEYQKEWNFIEVEYGERPNTNGLDRGNPGFAYTTNMAKYITIKDL